MQIKVKMKLGALTPCKANPGDAGYDLFAHITAPVTIEPGERILISAGFQMELPVGFEAQVRPRSGMAWKQGITVLNSPGTIDAGYRGDVGVILINEGSHSVTIQPSDKIAQMVIQRVEESEIIGVTELGESVRGTGGFGSSGR